MASPVITEDMPLSPEQVDWQARFDEIVAGLMRPESPADVDQRFYTIAGGLGQVGVLPETAITIDNNRETPAMAENRRRMYLRSLPHAGFEDRPGVYSEMIDQIAAVGFPVDNFRRFERRDNAGDSGNMVTLASWGIGIVNRGEFTVHHELERRHPEKRLATIGHESAHATTPLNPANAEFYGGEAERQEAAAFVLSAANQAIETGVTLNGYHKHLLSEYRANKIDHETFAEETMAIMSELALTNRARLEIVSNAQVYAMADKNRERRVQGLPPVDSVQLISTADRYGKLQTAGIDRNLIKLLEGVQDRDDLLLHIGALKDRFYPDETRAIAARRFELQNADELARIAAERELIRQQLFIDALAFTAARDIFFPADSKDSDGALAA
jgi:hypothetical protein